LIKVSSDTPDNLLANASRIRHKVLKDKIYAAENESDVRQAFLALYDLDLVGNLEKYRIDYAHPELWLEMKYDMNWSDINIRARVISQILHYMYYAPYKRSEQFLPDSFGIVDKSFILFYETDKFIKYILDPAYFKGIPNPSSPHPLLESHLIKDPVIKGGKYHILAEYDKVWNELNKRGVFKNLQK
jgi:hypothetical protein